MGIFSDLLEALIPDGEDRDNKTAEEQENDGDDDQDSSNWGSNDK